MGVGGGKENPLCLKLDQLTHTWLLWAVSLHHCCHSVSIRETVSGFGILEIREVGEEQWQTPSLPRRHVKEIELNEEMSSPRSKHGVGV